MKNKIRIYRAIKEVTQSELAKIIGVSRQTISAIEKNRYVPSTVLALKLAKYFEVHVEEVFELTEED